LDVIASFGDQATADIFHGVHSKAARRIPTNLWTTARRKLDALNAASRVDDMAAPPGNRLEALKGDLAGQYSIRINDQFRIVFRFEGGNAHEVRIVDYH
jgi:proteic killer suppression protein